MNTEELNKLDLILDTFWEAEVNSACQDEKILELINEGIEIIIKYKGAE